MFDVFHNVFGKKKSNSDHDRQSSDGNDTERSPSDSDFVIIGASMSDRTAVRDSDVNPKDAPPPFHLFEQLAVSDQNNLYPILDVASRNTRKVEPEVLNIMSLQGVPFTLNTVLNLPTALDQIWQRITVCLNSIVYPKSLETEYDFSVEKSVVS